MGPIVTRLFNAARPPKQKTIEEESEPFMFDTIVHPPPSLQDEEGMQKTPSRRMTMRKQYPNPKREM